MYYDSGISSHNKQPIVIRTLYGVVTDIGTQFEVETRHEQFQVSVREGTVNIKDDGAVQVVYKKSLLSLMIQENLSCSYFTTRSQMALD